MEAELSREVSRGHALHGLRTRAVARAEHCDDVAFEVEGAGLFVVHLTWRPETDPRWPHAILVDALPESDDGGSHPPAPPVSPRKGAHGRWPCACCGWFTLDERPSGTFEICPVCGWEDDGVQLADPDVGGGANVPSLREARSEYLRTGAADPDHRALTRPPRDDELE
jgi:hypothetical protein